jgi:hypothetical protein
MEEKDDPVYKAFGHPAGGRHAVASALTAFARQGIPLKVVQSFRAANRAGGFLSGS